MSDTHDASARAEAVLALKDLEDPASLRLLLESAADRTTLPARFRPSAEVDPFDAFFGGNADVPEVTLSDLAIGRLEALTVPPSSLDLLAAALAADPPEALVSAIARLAGTIPWDDPSAALRRLVPALHAADAPLYELIVRQGADGLVILVESAISPYRSRAVNELLNHGLAHHKMAIALCDGVVGGRIDPNPAQAMAILGQLVAWNVPRAAEVATALEPRYPWAVAYAAFDDASARERFRAFVASGEAFPEFFPGRLAEVLKSRPPAPGFPLEAWLRRCDGDPSIIVAWGAVRECIVLLREWAAVDDERGAECARLLVSAGFPEGLETKLPKMILDGGWDAVGLREVARVAGVAEAIETILVERPKEWPGLVSAWLASDPTLQRRVELADRLLAIAEAAPVTRRPMRRGGVHVQREGVDVPSLRALVASCDNDALDARLEAVLPYAGPS